MAYSILENCMDLWNNDIVKVKLNYLHFGPVSVPSRAMTCYHVHSLVILWPYIYWSWLKFRNWFKMNFHYIDENKIVTFENGLSVRILCNLCLFNFVEHYRVTLSHMHYPLQPFYSFLSWPSSIPFISYSKAVLRQCIISNVQIT